MVPTEDQIRLAAFDRWRRRGWPHGFDREDWFAAQDELTFKLNYRTILEYPLDAPRKLILSDRPAPYCRFCERTAPPAIFGPARPVVEVGLESSLYTQAICEECRSTFYNALAGDFALFRTSFSSEVRESSSGGSSHDPLCYTLVVFKSLVAFALTIMPASELRYFVDALEWVSNPASDRDAPLLGEEAACLVYSARFLRDRSWMSLARRTQNSAPFPYMIFFLAQGGVVLQVRLPLCLRDQDLDGRPVGLLRRSFMAADDQPFEQPRPCELRIGGVFAG